MKVLNINLFDTTGRLREQHDAQVDWQLATATQLVKDLASTLEVGWEIRIQNNGYDFDDMCVICENEGAHDINDRPHCGEGQE